MYFNDAVRDLLINNPDCDADELRAAFDSEVLTAERSEGNTRGRYARAIAAAHGRITMWLSEDDEDNISFDWRVLASFSVRNRPAYVYCKLVAKARTAEQAHADY